MSTVSVIIPSYNHGKYIAEAIQSVLDQTLQDFEIIITDDASADNTVEVIEKFTDPRIQLFCLSKNQGVSRALDFSIAKAKGKYIALLGSDDIAMSERLEKQVAFLDTHHEVGAVLSRAHIIDEESRPFANKDHFYYSIFDQPNRTRFEWLNYFFYHGNCLCAPSGLIRKSVYEKIGGHNPCYLQLQDFDFWIRLCFNFELYVLEDKLIQYRVRDNGMNVSSGRLENQIRSDWEYKHSIQRFFNISSLDELLKIFPELKNHYNDFTDALIPFYLAMLCLEAKSEHLVFPAVEALYNLLQNSPDPLLEKVNFSCPDFFKLVASFDVFCHQIRSEKKKLQQEKEVLQHENTKLTQEKNLLLNSISWKITQPLRRIKSLLSRDYA